MEAPSSASKGQTARVDGLPAVANERARVLILGSMPGARSLAERRYYVGPGNRFWTVMGRLLGFDPDVLYDERVQALSAARIALWDVLRSCERSGSADARIVPGSEVPNDFGRFFATRPRIRLVAFNGKKAARSFGRLVGSDVAPDRARIVELPSTSAANARYRTADLARAWRVVAASAR